jgi:L,D-transpeptidase catalytic domain
MQMFVFLRSCFVILTFIAAWSPGRLPVRLGGLADREREQNKLSMKTDIRSVIVALMFLAGNAGLASDTRVVINLSEQNASLIQQGRVTLVAPIASGKPGWSTPTGNFRILDKDIDHRSQNFGLVVDAHGNVINSNATPSSHVPRGCHYEPAPMPYFMEFSRAVGMHAGYLPGYPASHGCVRMPRDSAALFWERVQVGTRVTVIGSTATLTHVRRALPVFPTSLYLVGKR